MMKCVFIILLATQMSFAAILFISTPGQYRLGKNILFTPTGNDAIILINASDVYLDLQNYIIEQSGGSGTLNGIQIAAGVSDVTIANGFIRNLSGDGVVIGQNCNNIEVNSRIVKFKNKEK